MRGSTGVRCSVPHRGNRRCVWEGAGFHGSLMAIHLNTRQVEHRRTRVHLDRQPRAENTTLAGGEARALTLWWYGWGMDPENRQANPVCRFMEAVLRGLVISCGPPSRTMRHGPVCASMGSTVLTLHVAHVTCPWKLACCSAFARHSGTSGALSEASNRRNVGALPWYCKCSVPPDGQTRTKPDAHFHG